VTLHSFCDASLLLIRVTKARGNQRRRLREAQRVHQGGATGTQRGPKRQNITPVQQNKARAKEGPGWPRRQNIAPVQQNKTSGTKTMHLCSRTKPGRERKGGPSAQTLRRLHLRSRIEPQTPKHCTCAAEQSRREPAPRTPLAR